MRICKTQIYTLKKISIEKPSLFSEIVTPTQKKSQYVKWFIIESSLSQQTSKSSAVVDLID